MTHPVTIWVGVIITLTVLSYLVKDNVFYRLIQKAAMGTGIGIAVVMTWEQVLDPYWWTPMRSAFVGGAYPESLWAHLTGQAAATHSFWSHVKSIHVGLGVLWVLALIPGLLWYCQMSKKWFWLSTPIIGLFVGVAAGLAFKGQILLMLPQLGSALKPLNPWAEPYGLCTESVLTVLNNLAFMVFLFTTLLYFCFTIKSDNRFFHVPMKTGRLVIMVALGAMFGNTVMTRMSFLIERMQFLFQFFYNLFTGTPIGG